MLSNVTITVARQNAHAVLHLKTSDKPFGQAFQALRKDEGVSHDHMLLRSAPEVIISHLAGPTRQLGACDLTNAALTAQRLGAGGWGST